MSFDRDMAILTQKFLSETRNTELSVDEILKRPRWKRVWFWWKALEYYEGNPLPNFTIEEMKNIYGDE